MKSTTGLKLIKNTKLMFLYLFLITWTIVVLFPIGWAFVSSLKTRSEIFNLDLAWIPKHPTLENYISIIQTPEYLRVFANTLFVTFAASLLTIVFALTAGYGFSKFDLKFKKSWLTLILICQMFPQIMFVIPYFDLVKRMGLYDTLTALVISRIAFFLPFSLLLMRSFFDGLPNELEEAGLVDGCTRFGVFARIIAPLAIPGIVTVFVFTFVRGWNEYLFSLVLTQSISRRVITVVLASLVGEYDIKWELLMSMSILSTLPSLVVFVIMQKSFIKGLTAGAVKN